VLRITLRGPAGDAARTAPPRAGEGPAGGTDPHGRYLAGPEAAEGFAVLADRLTVESSGCLSLWQADEVVFCCALTALASISFEALGGLQLTPSLEVADGRPRALPAAGAVLGPADGPRAEAHRDLASANTRWTPADERRLLELHATGVSIDVLARTFGRRKGAVRARLFKLRRDTLPEGPEAGPLG
jgi:hypothetical protein